jgi:hypothetical protein
MVRLWWENSTDTPYPMAASGKNANPTFPCQLQPSLHPHHKPAAGCQFDGQPVRSGSTGEAHAVSVFSLFGFKLWEVPGTSLSYVNKVSGKGGWAFLTRIHKLPETFLY